MASVRVLNHILQKKNLIVASTSYHFNTFSNLKQNAWYSTKYSTKKSVTKVTIKHDKTNKSELQLGFVEVAKKNVISAGYFTLIVATLGFGAVIFYTLFKELFLSKSPTGVYSKALDRCSKDPRVIEALGSPIKGYGEGRRRRNHVSHMYFVKDNVMHMRVRFYIQGAWRRATVNVEVKENEHGEYEYTYLHVTVDHIGTIVLEDNRDSNKTQQNEPIFLFK